MPSKSTPVCARRGIRMEKLLSSSVKNKIHRRGLYKLEKSDNRKIRRELRKKRKNDQAIPKEVPKTIENSKIVNETTLLPNDEELLQDDKTDEFYDHSIIPKVVITSSSRPCLKSHLLMKELSRCIPNSDVRLRSCSNIKKIIPMAVGRGYTDILVVNEDRKIPNGLLLVHLPEGPSAFFKLTSFKRGYDIRGHGRCTTHEPEIVINNFTTHLGHTVSRMLATIFPYKPRFEGRQVVTFHNQRDYIFFRRHRYIFKNEKRVGMQELGPRFTLKLRSVQKGTFDSKFGEYLWTYKKGMVGQKKFNL